MPVMNNFPNLMKMEILSLRMSSMKLSWKCKRKRNCKKRPKLLRRRQILSKKSFRKGELTGLITLTICSAS